MLTQPEIEEITRIIQERVGISIYMTTGVAIGGLDIASLKKKGLISGVPGTAIKDAYVYGILSTLDPGLATAPYSVIKAAIAATPLSSIEKEAASWLSANAGIYCRGLGNTLDAITRRIIHDSSKELAMMGKVQETLSDAVQARKTRGEMVTLLRRATGDVQRDWHRIVNTEIHSARTQGVAHGLRKQFSDDVTIIVRSHPDCCDLCKKAYSKGGVPRVFSLKELSSRSNIGRKAAELRKAPGLPALHPHCLCEVMRFDPKIQTFDKKGRIIFRKRPAKKTSNEGGFYGTSTIQLPEMRQ